MIYGRQSTAIIVTVGPVLDADGVAVTDGVVGDFVASKNGAAPAALNGSATLTHRNTGHYSLSLTTTDTNTVGSLEIIINDTVNACPIKEIQVVEPVIYDAFFADAANAFTGAAGASKITGVVLTDTVTTYTGNTVQTGDSFARLGAPAGASVSADIAAIEAQTDDIGAAGAGLTAITSVLGTPAGASISADIAAIEAQTDDIGAAGAGLTAITSKTDNLPSDPADASVVAGLIAGVQADTDDIQTRLPAALVGGRMDSSVGAMGANVMTAAAAAADLTTELQTGLALEATAQSIKTKTDSLTYTVAGQVDANVQRINDVTITGDGQVGTEFGV